MIDIDDPAVRDRALRLNARADIRDIRMLGSTVEMLRLPDDGNLLVYDLNSSPEVRHSPGDKSFVVQITYDLSIDDVANRDANSAETDSELDSELVAQASFTLAALFSLSLREADEAPADAELEAYSLTTAQFLLYPYAREYIYDITGRLGLPSLSIGMLKMTATRNES